MNFFEHQDRARRQTRWLILMFGLALLAIVAAINAILLLALGTSTAEYAEQFSGMPLQPVGLVQANVPLLVGGAIATLGIVGIASLFRTINLKMGGGQVARQLGGSLVESDTRDHRRRRLRNVVEEIALASGVPVPEIYVLEQEAGINALAAGYSPADAAVAVTRGALENLSRDELQGVIAHEFSHILNGDMRLNIRLMGALFGILLLALIGRRVLIHARFGRSDKNAAAVLLIAAGLMAVGYIGLFFGRWIKAGVSRQREYLADASAIQFTRDPSGIGGALKKIAVYSDGSLLRADTEEVSHMLFGEGQRMMLFATHPPLQDRIRRIDPAFREEDLDRLRAAILRDQAKERDAARDAAREAAQEEAAEKRVPRAGGGIFDVRGMIGQIGQPGWEQMLAAAALAAALPDNVRRAAHSTEWAPEVLFYTLLDPDEDVRERQLNGLAARMGADSEAQVRALLKSAGLPRTEQRLPLLELAFPALKRRPPEFVSRVLDAVKALIDTDGRVEVFEFLLARVISQHLWESQSPDTVRVAGRRRLADCREPARRVLAVLARHGQDDPAAAASAFAAGCAVLGLESPDAPPEAGDWVKTLDADLPVLDRLKPTDKERFVGAMAAVVTHDGRMLPAELELLRAACALIHVPLPLLSAL